MQLSNSVWRWKIKLVSVYFSGYLLKESYKPFMWCIKKHNYKEDVRLKLLKKHLVCCVGVRRLDAASPANHLPIFTPPCLRSWLLHSSRSVAEVQNHLDHFTRGTKGAERSHWPCAHQALLYALLTYRVWHFSCICPLLTPPCVTTTAVQKKIIVYRDINQMNNIWGQSAVSAPSLLLRLSCKVTIMTECQKCYLS